MDTTTRRGRKRKQTVAMVSAEMREKINRILERHPMYGASRPRLIHLCGHPHFSLHMDYQRHTRLEYLGPGEYIPYYKKTEQVYLWNRDAWLEISEYMRANEDRKYAETVAKREVGLYAIRRLICHYMRKHGIPGTRRYIQFWKDLDKDIVARGSVAQNRVFGNETLLRAIKSYIFHM